MRKFFFLIGLLIIFAQADSLPWQGTVVFDTLVRVDDAPGLSGHPAYHPQTIVDHNLIFYSVWEDDRDNDDNYEIYFALSNDTAKTWITPNINLSQNLLVNDKYPWLCVDSNNLYVVWQSRRNDTCKVYLTRSTDAGTTWSTPDTIPGIMVINNLQSQINPGPQPKIAVDSKSSPDTTFLYVLWTDNATDSLRIKLARSIDLGQSFTDLGIVDNNSDYANRNPFLVVDDTGWIHCAWALCTSGDNEYLYPWIGYNCSQDRGNTFLAEDIIINDDMSEVYRGNPSLTYNPFNNNILICWEDARRGGGITHSDIWFSQMHRDILSPGSNQRVNWWEPDTSIMYDNFKPVVRIDPQGTMVAAWHGDPEGDTTYNIHVAAYNDSTNRFSNSQSFINTFTGTSNASFGRVFYQPLVFVRSIDNITNFFLVWQDFFEDSLGSNIYSVRGWVAIDLDVDNDSLDVENGTINLRTQPAGPAYSPYAKAEFVLVNTDASYNPDTIDGPSLEHMDSIYVLNKTLYGPGATALDSVFILGLSNALSVGQSAVCTLAVVIPEDFPEGTYTGIITIRGHAVEAGVYAQESFMVTVQGPISRNSLDSLSIVPIPFKPNRNPAHDRIHFQGLPQGVNVRVYDLSGSLVWSDIEDGDGHCAWNADAASGIYIYLVTASDGAVKKGKLSVIR